MLSEDQSLIRDTARAFARDRLAPHAAARDKAGTIEPEVLREMGELGFLGMTVSPDHDGAGADYVSYALALMEVAAGDGAISTVMSVHNAPFNAILERFGTPEQKAEVLAPAARGEFIGAFALTEAEAGSDASAIRTQARKVQGGYVIDGAKAFITSGRIARQTIVFARLEGSSGKAGITAFLVPTQTPGYAVARVEDGAVCIRHLRAAIRRDGSAELCPHRGRGQKDTGLRWPASRPGASASPRSRWEWRKRHWTWRWPMPRSDAVSGQPI
ncbi:MAG: acyl-CoA dehydrogenase family protein [Paracoccaceae bacterium]